MPSPSRLPSVPFPESTPTHPLLVIDYAKLTANDAAESARLFHAATTLGFWYLKNHGVDYEDLFDVGEKIFELPEVEKLKYDVGNSGNSFGYKAIGYDNVDENGNVDTCEQFNISRDDILSYPTKTHNDNPKPVIDALDSVRTFTDSARAVTMTLLEHLERNLQLPAGAFTSLHQEGSGFGSPSKARVIRNPPQNESTKLSLGSHTDFGSITLLNNNMTGGLQVLSPGSDEWQFVKPLEGHVVCNLADALVVLSGGILRSNLHRVLPPPGEQRVCTRWSGIFFLVPEFSTLLQPLVSLSPLIAEAAPKMANVPEPGTDCRAWFHRRLFGVRAVNRKGPESWLGSRGTEYVIVEGQSTKALALLPGQQSRIAV